MVSPTPVLQRSIRRLALTTKQAGANYYKGTRSGGIGGWHNKVTGVPNKYGKFKIDWERVRTYKCPDLTGFELRPFVGKMIEKTKGDYRETEGPMDARVYLEKWKAEGGKL